MVTVNDGRYPTIITDFLWSKLEEIDMDGMFFNRKNEHFARTLIPLDI